MPGTIATTGAFIRIDKPRFVGQCDCKIPWFTPNCLDFRVCDQVDVQMPADLDQFG